MQTISYFCLFIMSIPVCMQTINYFCLFIMSVKTSLYANHQLFLSLYYVSQYQSVCKPSTISVSLLCQPIPVCMQTINYFSLFIMSANVCMQTINYICLFIMSANTSLYANHPLFLSLYYVSQYQSVCKPSTISVSLLCQPIPVCMQTISYICIFIMSANTSLYANHPLYLSLYYVSQYQSVCKLSTISVSLLCQPIPVCMQTINYFSLFIMSVNTNLYANHQLFLSLYYFS